MTAPQNWVMASMMQAHQRRIVERAAYYDRKEASLRCPAPFFPTVSATSGARSKATTSTTEKVVDVAAQNKEAFFRAVRAQDVPTVTQMLQSGKGNVFAVLSNEQTPLHVAAKIGNSEIVSQLLKAGANIEAKDGQGLTPLSCAVVENHTSTVSVLIEAGANADNPDNLGQTPLYLAAKKASLAVLSLIVEKNKHLVLDNDKGFIAFTIASSSVLGAEKKMDLLYKAGVDVKTRKTIKGYTGLHYAAFAGIESWVRFYIENHARAIDMKTSKGATPLCLALTRGHMGIVRLLQDAGADTKVVHKSSNSGQSILFSGRSIAFAAAESGKKECLEFAFQTCKDVNEQDSEGVSPLHDAASFGRMDSIIWLIEHGAHVNIRNHKLETPLHWAAAKNQAAALSLLLNRGADATARTADDLTPLHEVAFLKKTHGTEGLKNVEMALALIRLGADVKAKANVVKSSTKIDKTVSRRVVGNFTPLHFAGMANDADMAQCLLEHGARANVIDSDLKMASDYATAGTEAHTLLLKANSDQNAINCSIQ